MGFDGRHVAAFGYTRPFMHPILVHVGKFSYNADFAATWYRQRGHLLQLFDRIERAFCASNWGWIEYIARTVCCPDLELHCRVIVLCTVDHLIGTRAGFGLNLASWRIDAHFAHRGAIRATTVSVRAAGAGGTAAADVQANEKDAEGGSDQAKHGDPPLGSDVLSKNEALRPRYISNVPYLSHFVKFLSILCPQLAFVLYEV